MRRLTSLAVAAFLAMGLWSCSTSPQTGQAGPAPATYAVDENTTDIGAQTASAKTPGPVRMARFSYVSGSVSWRPSDTVDWSAASINLPIRQGASISVPGGSRSEVQFDDGSAMQLGGNATAVLQTMYSDSSGEFTEISLTGGLASFMLRSSVSEFQIDTPQCAIKAFGPANFRVGVSQDVEVAVRSGEVQVQSGKGQTLLHAGDRVVLGATAQAEPGGGSQAVQPAQGNYANVPSREYRYQPPAQEAGGAAESAPSPILTRIPPADDWDNFCQQRDEDLEYQNVNLPPDENLVAGNLDQYGTWHSDDRYGEVWAPSVVSADWRPYSDGSWSWVSPVGWTWVDNEPWAYVPSHYGTWTHEPYGWAWSPGPARQCWSPAVVTFTNYRSSVAWCPLAPSEVQYPASLTVGFTSGDWSLYFSIGQAGCYYPATDSYCQARPWDNGFCNQNYSVYDPTIINNYYGEVVNNQAQYWGRNRFHPQNAYSVDGGSWASAQDFGTGLNFGHLALNEGRSFFDNGQWFNRVPDQGAQLAGPIHIRPSVASFTPVHRFDPALAPRPALFDRPVVRAPLPSAVRLASRMAAPSWSPSVQRAPVIARTGPTRFMPANVSGGFGGTQAGRPGARPGLSAANVPAPNRYNRFNGVSQSPFTRNTPSSALSGTQSRVTRNALHTGVRPPAATPPQPSRPPKLAPPGWTGARVPAGVPRGVRPSPPPNRNNLRRPSTPGTRPPAAAPIIPRNTRTRAPQTGFGGYAPTRTPSRPPARSQRSYYGQQRSPFSGQPLHGTLHRLVPQPPSSYPSNFHSQSYHVQNAPSSQRWTLPEQRAPRQRSAQPPQQHASPPQQRPAPPRNSQPPRAPQRGTPPPQPTQQRRPPTRQSPRKPNNNRGWGG